MEQVIARATEIAKVERLGVRLAEQCVARGATIEEALVGLISATLSAGVSPYDQAARIEWVRTVADLAERGLMTGECRTWKN